MRHLVAVALCVFLLSTAVAVFGSDINIRVSDEHDGEIKKILITMGQVERDPKPFFSKSVHSIVMVAEVRGKQKPVPVRWIGPVVGRDLSAVARVPEDQLPSIRIHICGDVSAPNACGLFSEVYRYQVDSGRFILKSK